MTNKFAIAALLSVFAVPALAEGMNFASNINRGRQMQADLLGLDAARFTTNELAQIAAEDPGDARNERIRVIEAEKGQITVAF